MINSRGHGRSTRDLATYTYEFLDKDVLAVMDHLNIERASSVDCIDGACVPLVLGANHPAWVSGVIFFGCNMDPTGALPLWERL